MTPSPSNNNNGNISPKKVVGAVVATVVFLSAVIGLSPSIPVLKRVYCLVAANSPLPLRDYCWKYVGDQQTSFINDKIISGFQAKAYAATNLNLNGDNVTLNENTQETYSIASSERLGQHNSEVYSLAFSPDGRTLVSGSVDGTIKLWNLSGGERASWKQHNGVVRAMTFSPNGKILVSSSRDGTIKFWDAANIEKDNRYLGEVTHEEGANSVAFLPKNCSSDQILASAGESGEIKLWNVNTEEPSQTKLLQTLLGHKKESKVMSRVWSVAFSPKCKILASGGHDSTIKLWNWKEGKLENELEMITFTSADGSNSRPVSMVAFSPDGTLVSSGFHSKHIHVFRNLENNNNNPTPSAKMKHYCEHNSSNDNKCNPDYSCLDSRDSSQKICGVHEITISKNGLLATGGYDSKIKIWNIKDEKEIHSFQAHGGTVRSLIFRPDGRRLVSGGGNTHASHGKDNDVIIWNPF